MLGTLGRVKYHDDHIARLRRADDLASTTFALGGSFDNTRQIEQLDLCAAILQHTRYGCKSCERVGCYLGPRLGHLTQEGGFADGRKANKCYACFSVLGNIEASATCTAGSRARLEKLCA